MKRIILLISSLIISISSVAQIPYFGTTIGDNKWYTYFQVKFTADQDIFYASFSKGLSENLDILSNVYSTGDMSFGGKYGLLKFNHYNLGIQVSSAFDLNNEFQWSNVIGAVFMNGMIIDRLGYCLNSWYTRTKDDNYFEQWSYLSYNIKPITIMVGNITTLNDVGVAAGLYWSNNNWNLYGWYCNAPDWRLTVGFDYIF